MSAESVIDQIKEALEGRPGQPMVLGVCRSLAERFGQETWIVRAVTIVMAVFWTLPVVAAYIILGFAMNVAFFSCNPQVSQPTIALCSGKGTTP